MSLALVALIAAASVAVGWAALFGGRLPAAYGTRSCQGKGWRKQFPEAGKADIRDFLSLFVSSFAFNDDQKLKLNPDDQILRIYRPLYPSPLLADALELETLARDLRSKYDIELSAVWHERLTLGQLYSHVDTKRRLVD
jgi:propanediol dehydratase small subunit